MRYLNRLGKHFYFHYELLLRFEVSTVHLIFLAIVRLGLSTSFRYELLYSFGASTFSFSFTIVISGVSKVYFYYAIFQGKQFRFIITYCKRPEYKPGTSRELLQMFGQTLFIVSYCKCSGNALFSRCHDSEVSTAESSRSIPSNPDRLYLELYLWAASGLSSPPPPWVASPSASSSIMSLKVRIKV